MLRVLCLGFWFYGFFPRFVRFGHVEFLGWALQFVVREADIVATI